MGPNVTILTGPITSLLYGDAFDLLACQRRRASAAREMEALPKGRGRVGGKAGVTNDTAEGLIRFLSALGTLGDALRLMEAAGRRFYSDAACSAGTRRAS